jgi:hypothetical protein
MLGGMYPKDLPSAGREELTAALASPDHLAYIDARVRELDAFARWREKELAKWQNVRSAVALFASSVAESDDTDDSGDDLLDIPQEPVGSDVAHLNGTASRPKTRRAGLLVLFHQHPNRVWRTRELAAELDARGWAGPSGNEANKVSRSLAVMVEDGEIQQIRKGAYKLKTRRPDARPSTLEEGRL